MATITPDVNNWGYFIKGWGNFISGWIIGVIKYFNAPLEEYKSIQPDGTSNNITKYDFDTLTVFRSFFCKLTVK